MESIRNAANAAAVALGYDQTDKEVAGDQLGELVNEREGGATTYGGEAPQNTYSGVGNSQSGIEPVSGKLGSGTAGQPYDAGNGVVGSNVGQSASSGYGSNVGQTATSGYGSNVGQTATSGYGSNVGQAASSGYGSNTSGINSGSTNSGINSGSTASGINSRNAPASYGSTTSGINSSSIPAGYESTSGYGNNTGYDNSTSRGLGADATQQGNHYTSTVVAGKLDSALGLDATRLVDGGSTGATASRTTGYGQDSYGREGSSHGLGSSHKSSHSHHGLGSDRAAGSDRYLFHSGNAPGLGGRNAIVDDFTDSNIHHEGSGDITGKLGSDASSGRAGAATGVPGAAIAGIAGEHKGKDTERSRKPGYGRSASGLGSNTWGLNSGALQPRESTTHKIERKAEEYTGVGAAGGAGYAATQSGREPLSGARGSGVAGAPYDQGNTYDGAAPQDTGITGAYGAGYGQDRGLSEATSGVNDLSVNDRQTGATGLAGGAYDGTSSQADYGATAPRLGSGSTFGAGGLSERIAGAPNPDSTLDECEENHHNAHPTGAAAHVDGTHKPTFLNYRNDEFGVPVAKGP